MAVVRDYQALRAYPMAMRRGTGFLLGYLLVGTIRAFVDIVRGCFELLGAAFGLLVQGLDHVPDRRAKFETDFRKVVAPYMPVLVEKRTKLLVADDYGVIRDEKWSRELGYFMSKVLWPRLGPSLEFAQRNVPYVGLLIDEMIAAEQTQSKARGVEMDIGT